MYKVILFSVVLSGAGSLRAQNLPYPRYLKIWNESVSTKEVLTSLGSQVTPEYQRWLLSKQRLQTAQKSSIEFLDRDQFFLKSRPTGLHLVNTGRLSEGQILISRKPFNFSDDESLASIAKRLEDSTGTQRSPGHWAPVLALIDLERKQKQKTANATKTVPTRVHSSTESEQGMGGFR